MKKSCFFGLGLFLLLLTFILPGCGGGSGSGGGGRAADQLTGRWMAQIVLRGYTFSDGQFTVEGKGQNEILASGSYNIASPDGDATRWGNTNKGSLVFNTTQSLWDELPIGRKTISYDLQTGFNNNNVQLELIWSGDGGTGSIVDICDKVG